MKTLKTLNWEALLTSGEDDGSFDASKEAITIADCSQPDLPLVYVNKGFEKMTGYKRQEILRKNCRFLQGEDTQQHVVEEMRSNINAGTSCIVEFINYRKNGSKFWNRLSLRPVFDSERNLIFYIGLQNEITHMKEFEDTLTGYVQGIALKK